MCSIPFRYLPFPYLLLQKPHSVMPCLSDFLADDPVAVGRRIEDGVTELVQADMPIRQDALISPLGHDLVGGHPVLIIGEFDRAFRRERMLLDGRDIHMGTLVDMRVSLINLVLSGLPGNAEVTRPPRRGNPSSFALRQ